MRICAVTVLYHPELSVIERMASYYQYVESLVIVDNTDIPNLDLYEKIKIEFPNSEIISNNKNLGIGEGFNIGFRYAKTQECDWVLTMDQDSSFKDSSYFDFSRELNKENIAIISPDHYIKPEELAKIEKFVVIEELEVMASGNLVSVSDWELLGGFNVDLFIDEVDNEFCLRLNLIGKKVVKIKNCFLFHNLGYMKKNWTGREFHFHSPIRYYYMYRNFFYMKERYEQYFPEWIAKKQKYMRKLPKYLLFYGDNTLKSWKFIYKGYMAYKKGEMGIYKG